MTGSRTRLARWAVVLSLSAVAACGTEPVSPPSPPEPSPQTQTSTVTPPPPPVIPAGDLSRVSQLVRDAIAAHRLPGAVVQIGHGSNVVFREAFGVRKLDGEPGLDGRPAPAEAMTEDTIFDLASLTKPLTTATAVMQLVEQGRLALDDPVQTYLPAFRPANDPARGAQVTLRMLLTHTSGIAGDLSLDGPWGLDAPDKDEGTRRALAAWVVTNPGETFHYSDINFIILGALVEKLTDVPLNTYVRQHIFEPLHMNDTRYLPAGTTVDSELLARIAPTAHDGDSPGINPNHGRLLRGTVHDPTARRMGGVSGSAGVFSTVHDVGLFAQALLDRLGGRPSAFPLQRATLEQMTSPQQPGTAGGGLRGLGWDIDTAHSGPRGKVFPVGSFGHTGFTGVTLWLDPGSNTYILVLANVIHQPGGPPIAGLSGQIATETAGALGLY
ncbi:serine hydrolase domain-containing protein [Mycobacterium sp. pV006]|uniref:serine hydrolase domain-containing protein n=1 Tax=Mycobacterium sp. pV006 TaxID=3238983 RepID=UPI00351B111B